MSQPDGLELVPAGTLNRPGPIGRFVRFALGVLCLSVVASITLYWASTARHPIASLDERALVLLAPLCILNYAVNIGFGRSAHPVVKCARFLS